jgi:drug/metabolite transporter (DMT)-like permease
MRISNSYVRAFLVSAVIAIAASIRYLQMYGTTKVSRHNALAISIAGFAFFITTLLVGTFSRRTEKPWSWPKVVVACFGCWIRHYSAWCSSRFYVR